MENIFFYFLPPYVLKNGSVHTHTQVSQTVLVAALPQPLGMMKIMSAGNYVPCLKKGASVTTLKIYLALHHVPVRDEKRNMASSLYPDDHSSRNDYQENN